VLATDLFLGICYNNIALLLAFDEYLINLLSITLVIVKSPKSKSLKVVYQRMIDVSLVDMSAPLRWIDQSFSKSIKGFGTAKDERISSLTEVRQLILNGRKQSKFFTSFHVKKLTPYQPTFTSEDVAVFCDEFLLTTKLGEESFQMHLFFTSVFQYFDKNWKCISFHGSAPPDGSTTEDTFHIDESKKRISELEEKVIERTTELSKKNQELQLEASLEKVRTASWMMKGTDELVNLVAVLFSELSKLGFDLDGGAIVLNIFDQQSDDITQWIIDANHQFPYSFKHPHFDNPILNDIRKAKRQGVGYFSNTYSRAVKNAFWKYYFANTDFTRFPKPLQKEILSKPTYAQSMALEKNTAILNPNINGRVLTTEQQYILKRFANVFEQSYTRFLDLQRAEAQVRESQLEAALERVRSKTMAMHSSQDVGYAVLALFNELAGMGDKSLRCGIIDIKDNITMDVWTAHQDGSLVIGNVDMQIHKLLISVFQSWKRGENYFVYKLTGKEQSAYFKAINESSDYPIKYDIKSLPKSQFCHCFFFSEGAIFAWSENEILGDLKMAFHRFADVFGQTYKRYIDLKKAEEQAKEAQIEAALEHVRAIAMAMRKPEDMLEICKTIAGELKKLEVQSVKLVETLVFNREKEILLDYEHYPISDHTCISTIQYKNHTEIQNLVHTMLNSKDSFWHNHLTGTSLREWIDYMRSINLYIEPQLLKEDQLNYYFWSLGNAALGLVTFQPLNDAEIKLFTRFRNVFGLSFTRFCDIEKAEAQAIQAELDLIAIKEAKHKAEQTLAELQATQKQLVQSEKMASLGELTAGIAHEIQNPLNFVNNFAEVNTELIDELETEANKGNLEEVKLLAKDIKENESKINFHGKRADAIVKSMLQHSRKSSGQKELTDINALCDEYLRLSYHGLRAKDKSFNAEFDTQFDTTLAPINVVPQDIGRVILNLINNGFYAVNERQKKDKDSGYKPRVTLTTRQEGNQVVIEVADNGTGMPDQVKEKIFQPFFTTKPTGEGTGLGLSLSYDIVTKGHGGAMEVMTKEGEYTNFILRIPT